MAVKSLFGWGGVMISTTDFTNAIGTIEFVPEYVMNTDVSGNDIMHFKGYRVNIEAELFNMDETDAAKIVTMIGVLNTSFQLGIAFGVYPRYLSTDAGSQIGYNCFLVNSIKPEDIAAAQTGQTLKLKFRSAALISEMPTNTSNSTRVYRITDSSNLGSYRTIDDTDNEAHRVSDKGV